MRAMSISSNPRGNDWLANHRGVSHFRNRNKALHRVNGGWSEMDTIASLSLALSGRYEIAREIGQGVMATVYLARDVRHSRQVALKVLHPDLAAALGAERFLAEIRTTANLQHQHILPLHDSGNADGLLFYVMPFVAGETLRTRLEREQQLPMDDALRIARETLS